MSMRTGIGYDVHRLERGRTLILGGEKIPYERGLAGHSDADVLVHAIMDALLGAAGMGDIGRHFPDSDPAYAGISSMELLRQVEDMLHRAGYEVINIDAVIMAERPRLASYIPDMEEGVAAALQTAPAKVNIKATTTEGLGYIGGGEGMAAQAICLLAEKADEARKTKDEE